MEPQSKMTLAKRKTRERKRHIISIIERMEPNVYFYEIWPLFSGRRGEIPDAEIEAAVTDAGDRARAFSTWAARPQAAAAAEQAIRVRPRHRRPPAAVAGPAPAVRLNRRAQDADDRMLIEGIRASLELLSAPCCPICNNRASVMWPVSRGCNHSYCVDCLLAHIKHTLAGSNTVKCPGCAVVPPAVRTAGIPDAAAGLIDPEFMRLCPGVSGTRFDQSMQIPAFLSACTPSAPKKCPRCSSWATSALEGMSRCPSGRCFTLFCNSCGALPHEGKTCEEAAPLIKTEMSMRDEAYVRATSKPCPVCGARIQHFRDHRCHHVKCGKCSSSLCFVCMGVSPSCKCSLYCNDRCGCLYCDACQVGSPCPTCEQGCSVCKGTVERPIYV